jgi:radical SAM superfamily enzyme YgiQ (UPF0313 family)
MILGHERTEGFDAGRTKKRARLVSVSFPGRDLSLGVVGLKQYAARDPAIANSWSIGISQFFLDTQDEEIAGRLIGFDADLYAFSTYVWNIQKALTAAKALKKWSPGKLVVLGGPEASGMAERLLRENDFVDFVVKGDGEMAFRELLRGAEPSEVTNLVYRFGGGVRSNPESQCESLDELPLPYESEDYRTYLDEAEGTVRAAIETSRGCPFDCAYCSWGRKRMRYFSLEKLRPAFEYLFRHPKVATVYITDSNPFLQKRRARELLAMLMELNTDKKPVTFELNPEYMEDEGLLKLISTINSEEFAFGVQSTSPRVLERIGRDFDGERYRRNIALMRRTNPRIQMWFSLIIGLPGDDYAQFTESLDYVLRLKPDGIYIHELLCLPGSKFYDNPAEYGIEYQRDPPHKIVRNETFPPDQYERAKWLSYNVSLIHRVPALRDRLFELHGRAGSRRLVDLYEDFVSYLGARVDTLSGRRLEDVTSWFFEQYAREFLSRGDNAVRLESLAGSFCGTAGGAGVAAHAPSV